MTERSPHPSLIFESPDRGETVFARSPGSTDKHLYSQSVRAKSVMDQLTDDRLWGEIRRAARTNPTLQKALEQCIIIHHLSKEHGSTT